jgi:hypothetical protein
MAAVDASLLRIAELVAIAVERRLAEVTGLLAAGPGAPPLAVPAALQAVASGPLFPGEAPGKDTLFSRAVRAFLALLEAAVESRPDSKIVRDRSAEPAKRLVAVLHEAGPKVRLAVASANVPGKNPQADLHAQEVAVAGEAAALALAALAAAPGGGRGGL